MSRLTLSTPRLELIAGSAELLRMEWDEPARFARQLDVRLPDDWPPGLYDEDARRYFQERFEADPASAHWLVWYVVQATDRVLIGSFGFFGPPDGDGQVTLGYSVSAAYQRRGYATEAVKELVRWAFEHPAVLCVIAETFPQLTGSIKVLQKNGFQHVGAGSDDGSIRFRLDRPARTGGSSAR
jgi:RimJ/RimL family protein N-acetyltransferase